MSMRPFENMFAGALTTPTTALSLRGMPMDVVEKEDRFELKADVPGVNKNDIQVSVEQDVLTIKVDQKKEKEEETEKGGAKYHRYERSTQFVQRSLRMPETANMEAITAKYENGVLCLDIQKKKEGEMKEGGKRIEVS